MLLKYFYTNFLILECCQEVTHIEKNVQEIIKLDKRILWNLES